MRIAYLEDDPETAATVSGWLESCGYQVAWFDNGEKYVRAFKEERFSACLLDYKVPRLSGFEVMNRLRNTLFKQMPPVIFLTGQDSEQDVVDVLRSGADDYIVKPCSREILLARVGAVLRRYDTEYRPGRLHFGNLHADIPRRQFFLNDELVPLTERETVLACCFFENIGSLVTRDYLLKVIFEYNVEINTRSIDTHVGALRKKLSLTPENGWRLSSIYGKGYRLEQR